jgi:hypothetical protein
MASGDWSWRMNAGAWEVCVSLLRANPDLASRADHGQKILWRSFRSAGGSQIPACSDCPAAPSLHRRDVAAAGRPSPCLLTPQYQRSAAANQV